MQRGRGYQQVPPPPLVPHQSSSNFQANFQPGGGGGQYQFSSPPGDNRGGRGGHGGYQQRSNREEESSTPPPLPQPKALFPSRPPFDDVSYLSLQARPTNNQPAIFRPFNHLNFSPPNFKGGDVLAACDSVGVIRVYDVGRFER